MPENNLAWELYGRITEISKLQEIQYVKGEKQMTGYFPTLEKMEFIFKYYLPDMDMDGLDSLIEKISLIHQLKLGYKL